MGGKLPIAVRGVATASPNLGWDRMSIEIKIGKATYPIISVAKTIDNGELVFVFKINDRLLGFSTSKMVAPIRFHNNRPIWGNKPISFI